MNPPPLPAPFGDPAGIRKERSAAVGKGIGLGCGIFLLVIFVGVILLAGIAGVVLASIRQSDACRQTFEIAKASPALQQALGEPMELGWLVTGSIRSDLHEARAELSVPVKGPRGSAKVHAIGSREGKKPWVFEEMSAAVEGSPERIDLLRRP